MVKIEHKEGYTLIDRREPEPCRVCLCPTECHSTQYGEPTMKCIQYLREARESAEKELSAVADMLDDIFFDPKFRPVDSDGNEIKGDDYYLVDHPLQEHHIPALRQWFANFQRQRS